MWWNTRNPWNPERATSHQHHWETQESPQLQATKRWVGLRNTRNPRNIEWQVGLTNTTPPEIDSKKVLEKHKKPKKQTLEAQEIHAVKLVLRSKETGHNGGIPYNQYQQGRRVGQLVVLDNRAIITVTHHIYVIHSDQSSKLLETLLRDCRVLALNLKFLHNLFKPPSLLYRMVQVSCP